MMAGTDSKVTVLMAVYNSEVHLSEAVRSILEQSYRDFEFLIVDDASTDRSVEVVESFGDPRIRLLRNERNLGLAVSLNRGLEVASGEYIARMDGDDISAKDRLMAQIDLLDRNPRVGACGTWIKHIHGERIIRYYTDPDILKCILLFDPPMAHPTVMFRRGLFLRNGLLYDGAYRRSQDYELWARASDFMQFENIPKTLLYYRYVEANGDVSVLSKNEEQKNMAGIVRRAQLGKLHIFPTPEEFDLHQRISGKKRYEVTREYVQYMNQWLEKLREANVRARAFPEPAFTRVLAMRWFYMCLNSPELGGWRWKYYLLSSLGKFKLKDWRFNINTAVHMVRRRWWYMAK
jgi:glycosyltransferase involved in cell wall biosynthesis